MEDFYIILPSNTPVLGNKTPKFTVRLPETLELGTNWSVALSSIIYPYSFTALGIGGTEFIKVWEVRDSGFKRIYLPEMNFKTASGLANKINATVSQYFEGNRQKRDVKENSEIEIAIRVSQRAHDECDRYIKYVTKMASTSMGAIQKFKESNTNALNVPEVKTWIDKWEESLGEFQASRADLVKHRDEAKTAKEATIEHGNNNNIKEAKKSADIAKAAVQKAKSAYLAALNKYNDKSENGLKGRGDRVETALIEYQARQKADKKLAQELKTEEISVPRPSPAEEARQEDDAAAIEIFKRNEEISVPVPDLVEEAPQEADTVVNELNERLKHKEERSVPIPSEEGKVGKNFELRFDSIDQKFIINLSKEISRIELTEHLAYVLGFKKRRLSNGSEAEYMPDLSGGVRQLYIYAPNLVENTIIGDRMAPLLRIVNVIGNPGSISEVIYSTEYFHRLQAKRISEISIEIHTPFGELVKFHWGSCILTLHFKKTLF